MGREWRWSRWSRRGEKEKEVPTGCMSSVLQMFDLHQMLLRTTTTVHSGTEGDSFPQDHLVTSPGGLVAPRNSLELEDATVSSASAVTGEEEYNVPIGAQLVPERKTPLVQREQEVGERMTRKGNVVARLMGLDQIPDQAAPRTSVGYYSPKVLESPSLVSPRHQQRKTQNTDASGRESAGTPPPRRPLQHRNPNILVVPDDVRHGTRSLPETPRISLARSSWDTDPRLSLQLNYKENASPIALKNLRCSCDAPGDYTSVSLSHLFAKSKRRVFRQQLEENGSPSQYAQDILKQVKESVTRRVASRDCDDSLVRSKARSTKGSEKKTTGEEPNQGRTSTVPSSSPRLRFLEFPKNKRATLAADDIHILNSSPTLLSPSLSRPPPHPSFSSVPASDREIVNVAVKASVSSGKGKKANSERFMERIRKPPVAADREDFVSPSSSTQPRKKFRPSIPAFVPGIRKDSPIIPPPSSQPQVHVSASPTLPQISDQHLTRDVGRHSRGRSNNSASPGLEEYRYVRCVLESTGVLSRTPFPFATARWYSPSHPVDPHLFHQLERSFEWSPGLLQHRCNRKLLFNLVDEVLADLLLPVLHATVWPRSGSEKWQRQQQRQNISDGEALMQGLWSQIRSYPSADCRVIEDIDVLVAADLPAANVRQLLLLPAVVSEARSVASELEAAIVDSLVGEAVATLLTPV